MQVKLPAEKPSLHHPRIRGTTGLEQVCKVPMACLCPLGWGSYLQPPSLGSPHLQLTAPSAEWCPKKLGRILGTLGKGEGEKIQALGVSYGTVHSS